MPLPATPPLDILQILTFFGAPVGTPLTAMVRGGAYVPNIAANANVPTAPPISVLDFLGADLAAAVTFGTYTASALAFSPSDAYATVTVLSNGTVTRSINQGAPVNIGTWLPGGNGSAYDIFVTNNGPDPIQEQGSLGVWINMGVNRSFTVFNGSNFVSTRSAALAVQVRPAGGGANVDTGDILLDANIEL